jgi:hypothetical protein
MPDRRLFDLGQRIQDTVDLPDFDALRGRGRQLVRTRILTVTVVVAIAAAAGGTVATAGWVDRSEAPVTDLEELPLRDLTPEQVVQHPSAQLESFAVDPNDPDVRAAVWQVPCASSNPDYTCDISPNALAVTDDGFETASYVDLADDHGINPHHFTVDAVGDGSFYFSSLYGLGRLVDADGDVTPVARTTTTAPLDADDVLLEAMVDRQQLALDVETARAHPVYVPPGDWGFADQRPDGTLWTHTDTGDGSRVHWSTDGGATWSETPAPIEPGGGVEVDAVPSAADDTMALVEASEKIHPYDIARSTDGGRTWEAIDGPSGIAAYWVVVRPDGSLLMQGDDGRIYATDGTDWTGARPAVPGLPSDIEWDPVETYGGSAVSDDGTQIVYAVGATDQTVWATSNGVTWEAIAAR